jgi:hypothetical protein
MTSSIVRPSAFALAIAMIGGVLSAQQPTTRPAQPTGQPAAQPAQPPGSLDPAGSPKAFRATEVIGSKVAIQNNATAGTVNDIVFTDGGDVEYLIVQTNDKKLVTVPWTAANFNLEQKTAVVNITPEQFKTIPTYTVQSYPQFFTPAYRTQIYKAYGLTPGELRRIDRRLDRKLDRRNP